MGEDHHESTTRRPRPDEEYHNDDDVAQPDYGTMGPDGPYDECRG